MITKTLTLVSVIGLAFAAPAADEAGPHKLVKVAHSVDVFGLNLLHHLEMAEPRSDNPKNLLISPFSISSVLTTLLAGSAEQTHKQMARTLGYEHEHLTEKEILHNYAELRHGLNRQLKHTKNVLETADAVAIQKGFPVLESFHEALKGEEIMTKNFHAESHRATEEINHWVKERTHDKIHKLFGQDLPADTAMVLLNAIYFKGLWKKPFKHEDTKKATFHFHGRDGRKVEEVEMMSAHGRFGHAHFEDGDLLEIPFANESISFLAFLPSEKHANDQTSLSSLFGASLESDSTKLSERLAHIRNHEVNVHLPKFKIESQYSLNRALSQLGMHDAFMRGKADFSRINGNRDLVVSDVAHKAFIEVNEEGSEAAAATGVIMVPTSVQLPVHFNADRPFLFMIYDKEYQLALFTGVVNKP